MLEYKDIMRVTPAVLHGICPPDGMELLREYLHIHRLSHYTAHTEASLNLLDSAIHSFWRILKDSNGPFVQWNIWTKNEDYAPPRLHYFSHYAYAVREKGCGHNGHIGAAIYSPTTNVTKGKYIGTDDTHNVYAAELIAIRMAITAFQETTDKYWNVYIFTDNQSAIQAVDTPMRQSGQYIIEEILDIIDGIHEHTSACIVHIEWVPGHKNIEGNEKADQAAKTAATPNSISPNITIKSAQNRSIQSMTKTKLEAEWRMGRENARRLRNMSEYPDTTTGPKLYRALQRKHAIYIA